MIDHRRQPELDEGQLAEAEAESDLLDADLEDYEESPRAAEPEAADAPLDEFQLAEADAEA